MFSVLLLTFYLDVLRFNILNRLIKLHRRFRNIFLVVLIGIRVTGAPVRTRALWSWDEVRRLGRVMSRNPLLAFLI